MKKNTRTYTKNEKQKISSLKKKMESQARLPGYVYTKEWAKVIGPAYPLLGVITCACDWKTGIWRGQIWLLSEVIGRKERTISNWINRLKKIDGLEVRRFPYSISIELPKRLIPNHKSSDKSKKSSNSKERGKNSFSDTQKSSLDMQNQRLSNSNSFNNFHSRKRNIKDGPQLIAELF